MGTNEKQERRLKQHEKPIWRKAFEESMKHTSIEGATRNAWKAVDAWNRSGAFNESSSDPEESTTDETVRNDVWSLLIDWFETLPVSHDLDFDRLVDAMRAHELGKSTLLQFKEDLREMFDGSG